MKRYPIFIIFCLAVISISVAQDTRRKMAPEHPEQNYTSEMPTVDQILDKYTQAMGGAAAFRKLTTRVLTGTIEIATSKENMPNKLVVTGEYEIYAAAPNKRVEINQLKGDACRQEGFLEGFNGTVGWSNWVQFRKLEGAQLAEKRLEAEFYREIKLKDLYPRMILSGTEKVGDHWAYVIDATPTEGPPEKMYFDTQTGLLVRRDMAKYVAGVQQVHFQLFLEDYREIDGIKLPFTLRFLSPEVKINYKFNMVKHNVPIESAKIDLPDFVLSSQPDSMTGEAKQLSSLYAPTTDEYIRMEMKRRCIPGLALVVIKNGEVVKMNGYGLASRENGVPVTPDSVFEIASVIKPITATAVMLLVEQGKIKLDDPIVQYLPDSPTQWNDITVRHLLTHTAGLRKEYFQRSNYSRAGVFSALSREPLRFKPGSEHHYSNAGYFLLGMIIEKVSGRRYMDFLAEKFFKPLGMMSTSVSDYSAIVKNRVVQYTLLNGMPVLMGGYVPDDLPSSYGVSSTVRDMAKWDIALAAGKLVKEPSLAVMWTPMKLNNGSAYPYGFGWEIETLFGHRMISHAGHAGTEYTIIPDDRLTVIVLTNLGGEDVNSWGLTQGVAIRYLSKLP
jgi:CubicO group peptidase (beta-lactamase class C family)